MNPLVFILGLLGVAFAGSGSGSGSTTSSSAGASTNPEPDATTTDDNMDVIDNGSGMTDGDHNHSGSGDADAPSSSEGYTDITSFGMFHGSSSHTMSQSLESGRTAITTEAMETYNGLRAFLGLDSVDIETIGQWAFENDLTNNDQAYGQDLQGVGLYYGMQGAKAGWISDESFDPQLLADVQRLARQDETDQVMDLVEANGHDGFAAYLESESLVETFINTMKMEPHYGGWMHGRTHGDLGFSDETGTQVATAHDLNHLTVLSHDQTQPFMNDTFDWPQWPALEAPEEDVIDYFQSMVTLGDPRGDGIMPASDIPATSVAEDLMVMIVSEVSQDLGPSYVNAEIEEDALLF